MFEVRYLQGSRSEEILFSNLTFKMNEGEWIWVKGDNGSGKSTLLKILSGLIIADKGNLYWQNKKLTRFDTAFLDSLLYIGHNHSLNPLLTVIENLQWSKALSKPLTVLDTDMLLPDMLLPDMSVQDTKDISVPGTKNDMSVPGTKCMSVPGTKYDMSITNTKIGKVINKSFYDELNELDINNIANNPCENLSFGQKQRISLLRLAINNSKKLWILDEPGTGLDQSAKIWLQEKIKQHLQNRGMAIIATHEPLHYLNNFIKFSKLINLENYKLDNDNSDKNKLNKMVKN